GGSWLGKNGGEGGEGARCYRCGTGRVPVRAPIRASSTPPDDPGAGYVFRIVGSVVEYAPDPHGVRPSPSYPLARASGVADGRLRGRRRPRGAGRAGPLRRWLARDRGWGCGRVPRRDGLALAPPRLARSARDDARRGAGVLGGRRRADGDVGLGARERPRAP